MFEKFTRSARDVVIRAQSIAREVRAPQIDSTHLLLALADGSDTAARALRTTIPDAEASLARLRGDAGTAGLDAEALLSLGIDVDDVVARADAVFGAGAFRNAGTSKRHIPFRNDAKKTLELALREAIRLGDRTIESRHILLGLLRTEGAGYEALVAAGADTDSLRATLVESEAA